MSLLPFPDPEKHWPQPRIDVRVGTVDTSLLCPACKSPRVDVEVRPDNSCVFHCFACKNEFNRDLAADEILVIDSEAWRTYLADGPKSLAAELKARAILRDRSAERAATRTRPKPPKDGGR